MLYTKVNSHVTRKFGLSHLTKYKNTCVLPHTSVNLDVSGTVDVPNLKEIEPWVSYFYVVQKFFTSGAKKKKKKNNVKKIGQFLEVYILFTTNPISLKFDV